MPLLDQIAEIAARGINRVPGSAWPILILFGLVGGSVKVLTLLNNGLRKLKSIDSLFQRRLVPWFYSVSERNRVGSRRTIAEDMLSRIKQIDADKDKDWKPDEYSDLEVEIETGSNLGFQFKMLGFGRRTSRLIREPLERTLLRRHPRLAILQGDPGSGKSVGLRHLTRQLSERAAVASQLQAVIPVYIDLRSFKLPARSQLNGNAVETFVLNFLNPNNAAQLQQTLKAVFARAKDQENWLFLFDSFDEIPAILKATEADEVIAGYASAIEDFMRRWKHCRAILASRLYRGPHSLQWQRVTIVPLSESQQRRLMRQAGLTPDQESVVKSCLVRENSDLFRNTLVFRLLCDFVRANNVPPDTHFSIYESFVEKRLSGDAFRLRGEFSLNSDDVAEFGEYAAFAMARDDKLGLAPTVPELIQSIRRNGYSNTSSKKTEKLMRALEAASLAELIHEDERETAISRFAFRHRRIQEYFATKRILRQVDIISPDTLLLDGRWRETAVVLMRVGTRTLVENLCTQAAAMLRDRAASLLVGPTIGGRDPDRWPWPPGALALLSLLQDGLANRSDVISPELKEIVEAILMQGERSGIQLDLKFSLELFGAASEKFKEEHIIRAFDGQSELLMEAAYAQLGRLATIAGPVSGVIRGALLKAAHQGRLNSDWQTVIASISRLRDPKPYIAVAKLLRIRGWVNQLQAIAAVSICEEMLTVPATAISLVSQGLLLLAIWYGSKRWIISWDRKSAGNAPLFAKAFATPVRRMAGTEAVARLLIVLVPIIVIPYQRNSTSIVLDVVGIASTVVGLWVLAVPWALKCGIYEQPGQWPLILIAPAIVFARRVRSWRQSLTLQRLKQLIFDGIIYLIPMAVVVSCVALTDSGGSVGTAARAFGDSFDVFWKGVFALGIVFGILLSSWQSFGRFLEQRRVNRLLRESGAISYSRLTGFVSRLRTPMAAARLFNVLRNERRIEATVEIWKAVRFWEYVGAGSKQGAAQGPSADSNVLKDPAVLEELTMLESDLLSRMGPRDRAEIEKAYISN